MFANAWVSKANTALDLSYSIYVWKSQMKAKQVFKCTTIFKKKKKKDSFFYLIFCKAFTFTQNRWNQEHYIININQIL